MGCGSGRCGSGNNDSTPSGCGSSGSCASGGCNRLNTYDWLADINEPAASRFDIVEVSFKNGARKEFVKNPFPNDCLTGDYVAIESRMGYDIGKISLSGELVRLQMRKKNVKENNEILKIIRKANERDMQMAETAWSMEYNTMLMARVMCRDLNLDMKIGDVEYQGDGRKATFFYIAPGRVDFRELIKMFAREFQVKIEMRQIGNRFEASRIGGIGSCGRELCCSTWLTKFKPVNTAAARYQNLAINQAKLSGQCGRLKCCLNFELDTYVDALNDFPKNIDFLKTKEGNYRHFKTDIFGKKLWYVKPETPPVCLPLERVKEVLEMNARKEFPETLEDKSKLVLIEEEPKGFGDHGFEQFDLPSLPKEKRGRNRNRRNRNNEKDGKKGSDKPNKNVAKQPNKESTKNKEKNFKKPNKPNGEKKQQQPKKENPNAKKNKPEGNKPNVKNENNQGDKSRNKNRNRNRNKGNNNGKPDNNKPDNNDKKE